MNTNPSEYAPLSGPVAAQPLADGSGWCIKSVPGQITAETYGPDAERIAQRFATLWNRGEVAEPDAPDWCAFTVSPECAGEVVAESLAEGAE